MIFSAYNNFRRTNLEVLDALSSKFARSVEECSIRVLANITNYCANLNYTNQFLFTTIEKELVRRLKKTAEFDDILKKQIGDEFKFLIDLENELTTNQSNEEESNEQEPNEQEPNEQEPNEQEPISQKQVQEESKSQETNTSTTEIQETKPSKLASIYKYNPYCRNERHVTRRGEHI